MVNYSGANLNDIHRQLEFINQNLARIAELLEMLVTQKVEKKKKSK